MSTIIDSSIRLLWNELSVQRLGPMVRLDGIFQIRNSFLSTPVHTLHFIKLHGCYRLASLLAFSTRQEVVSVPAELPICPNLTSKLLQAFSAARLLLLPKHGPAEWAEELRSVVIAQAQSLSS